VRGRRTAGLVGLVGLAVPVVVDKYIQQGSHALSAAGHQWKISQPQHIPVVQSAVRHTGRRDKVDWVHILVLRHAFGIPGMALVYSSAVPPLYSCANLVADLAPSRL
jgi:hypothetical protein